MTKSKPPRSGPGSPVGYRNPPREHQFKPGRSGNPPGRPRGSKSFATLLERELNRPIRVTEGGRQRVITKREAAVKQYVNNLLRGDPASIKLMLGLSSREADPVDPQEQARIQEQVKKIADILDLKAAYKAKYGSLEGADPEPPKEDKS